MTVAIAEAAKTTVLNLTSVAAKNDRIAPHVAVPMLIGSLEDRNGRSRANGRHLQFEAALIARLTIFIALILGPMALSACQGNVPPLLQGATSVGGQGYDCQLGTAPASDHHLARSPEVIERLRNLFPPGSPAMRMRASLVRQGFKLEGLCGRPASVNWAQYRQNANQVVANIYWLEGPDGRIVWTFAEVDYTFL